MQVSRTIAATSSQQPGQPTRQTNLESQTLGTYFMTSRFRVLALLEGAWKLSSEPRFQSLFSRFSRFLLYTWLQESSFGLCHSTWQVCLRCRFWIPSRWTLKGQEPGTSRSPNFWTDLLNCPEARNLKFQHPADRPANSGLACQMGLQTYGLETDSPGRPLQHGRTRSSKVPRSRADLTSRLPQTQITMQGFFLAKAQLI